MFIKILVFALMTFWIWGWIFLWPISKLHAIPIKGALIFTVVLLAAVSGILDLKIGLNPSIQAISAFFGVAKGLWISILLCTVGTDILLIFEDDRSSSTEEYFGMVFLTVAVMSLIMWLLIWGGGLLYNSWLVPVFRSLFLNV